MKPQVLQWQIKNNWVYWVNMLLITSMFFGQEREVIQKLRHPNATSTNLLSQINAWMKEISPGVSLNTKYVPEVNKVILDYQFDLLSDKTNSFRPKNVGFGISYVLPIVLALPIRRRKIIVIENPESHIHREDKPNQENLFHQRQVLEHKLFVETHSDHILNGIRVAVKEKLVDKSKVNLMYFEKTTTEKEQFTKITPIKVDDNGELSDYPENMNGRMEQPIIKAIVIL